MSTRLSADKLQERLQTRRFGQSIFLTKSVASTNEWAKKLAKLGATEGTVVVAETQTHGRGRQCRKWTSPTGGLWFSVIMKPKIRPQEAAKLVFVAGLAVAKALRELYGLKAATKWPNDVLLGGRKVCGILTEMSTEGGHINFAITGIGINANFDVDEALPTELSETATSIKKELGSEVQLEELLSVVLQKFENFYDLFLECSFAAVLKQWKKMAAFLGSQVRVSCEEQSWTGLASDVDGDGALVLELDAGEQKRFRVGDVSLRGK